MVGRRSIVVGERRLALVSRPDALINFVVLGGSAATALVVEGHKRYWRQCHDRWERRQVNAYLVS